MKYIKEYSEFVNESVGTPLTLYTARASSYLSQQLKIVKAIEDKKTLMNKPNTDNETRKTLQEHIAVLKEKEEKIKLNLDKAIEKASEKVKKLPQAKRNALMKMGESEKEKVDKIKEQIIELKQIKRN